MEYTKKYINNFWKVCAWILPILTTIIIAFATQDTGGMIGFYCIVGNSFFGFHLQYYAPCPIYVTIGYIISISTIIALVFFMAISLVDISRIGIKKLYILHNTSKYSSIKIRCKIFRKENDVYIEVKNREWFIDATTIFVQCAFIYKGVVVQDRIKWKDVFHPDGGTGLKRRKRKLLHFATIDESKNEYYLHLLDKELVFQFSNGRVIELHVGGTSSKPKNRYITYTIAILEEIKDGKISLQIGSQM